jgi:phage terminase large subunit
VPRLQIPEKLEPIFQPNRYKVLWGGRGSAKSWTIAAVLVLKATTEPIRVLCARETQKSIQESVHRLIKDTIDRLGVAELFEVQETRILGKNGSDFAFAGIRQQSVANLKSFEGVDICWVEEAQVVTKRSWDVLIPTIRKPGSEIWLSLNPELDTDETYTRFVLDPPQNAWTCKVNWHDNPWFGKELDDERQLMERRDPIGYRTVWMGECRPAVEGAIYAQELDQLQRSGRFTTVSHDPLLKTHTVWDLGWNDETVILLVQRAASELRIIGAYISRFSTYEADIAELRLWAEARDLNGKLVRPGLQWGTDWLPHDAKAQVKSAGGLTGEKIVKALGRTVEIVPNIDVEDGIKQTRTAFPRMWIDKGCQDWLNAIKRYHRHVTADGSKTGIPVHDDASHGADALRYLAIVAEKLNNHHVQKLPKIQYSNAGIV